jgi:hypothetical protein
MEKYLQRATGIAEKFKKHQDHHWKGEGLP